MRSNLTYIASPFSSAYLLISLDRRFKTQYLALMETVVVNLRLEKCDVKITRTPKNEIPDPPKFGCFGNPYALL